MAIAQRRRPTRSGATGPGRTGDKLDWLTSRSDDELLDLRLSDLKLSLAGTRVEGAVRRLYEELSARGLNLRPHVWLSTEWFSPDGVPGIGIPFYLSHRRLMRIEARQMLEVEGGTTASCMRILRHEAGHCIDTAYRLHFRKRWRQTFGPYSKPYPDFYRPKPGSRRFVLHLDWWYAQAHPAEDFAETFAVWLTPRSTWRQQYQGWPALRKLMYVDELMGEIAGAAPLVRSRRHVDPIGVLNGKTLRQHYREKRRRYLDSWPSFYDNELHGLFSSSGKHQDKPTAAGFLRRNQRELRETVSRWTGTHPYAIDQVVRDMIDRCTELNLRLGVGAKRAKAEALIMVTMQTMAHVHSRRHRVAL